jgi:hypothetical protein
MEKYNLFSVAREDWIPTQVMMDALNELASNPDFISRVVAIGIEIGKVIVFPPEVETLEQALLTWNASYHAVHRGADVGDKCAELVKEGHYRVTFTDLYPDDFNYGIMYGFALRFLPPGTNFTIYYDPAIHPRDRGGDHPCTVIHMRWT